MGRNPAETRTPSNRAGSPAPVRLKASPRKAPTDSKARVSPAKVRKSTRPQGISSAPTLNDGGGIRHGNTTRSTFGIRQRLEQNRVDDAEDGGARADAERQRQRRDDGEGCVLPQHAPRVTQVVRDGLDERHTACVAAVGADLFEAAEVDVRAPRGFLAAEPRPLVLHDLRVEVGAQLIVEVGIHLAAAHEGSRTEQRDR